MFLLAALALSGLPISGIFRSEFQIVSGGFARPDYAWAALLVVLLNVAFFGVLWHVARMVLGGGGGDPPVERREMSWWMVVPMVVCVVAVIGLGFHVPGSLSDLLSTAAKLIGGGS